jgi:hypothetical protein
VSLHPTSPTFTFLSSSLPRIYLSLDSGSRALVMNELRYPSLIESFKVGTDSQPAVADRRLVWLLGLGARHRPTGGACRPPWMRGPADPSSGQRQFEVRVSGVSMNLLDMVGQSLPICNYSRLGTGAAS